MLLLDDADGVGGVVVHELYHLFQAAAGRGPVDGGWWVEATAAHFEFQHEPNPALGVRQDENFLLEPQLPLDLFHPGDSDVEESHPYGARRFVAWLLRTHFPTERAENAFLRDTFRRIARGAGQTDALEDALAGHRLELRELLGQFWIETVDRFTHVRPPWRWPEQTIQPGTTTIRLGPEPLGTMIRHLKVAPGVLELNVRYAIAPGDGRLWALTGRTTERWDDDEESFCVSGPDVADSRPWPTEEELTLAFANGSRSASSTVVLTIEATTEPCRSFGGAMDRARCQPLPYWRPPAGFTDAIVLRDRIGRMVGEWGAWYRTALGGTIRDLIRTALITECLAARIRGLDQVPARYRPMIADHLGHLARLSSRAREVAHDCVRRLEADGWPFSDDSSCSYPRDEFSRLRLAAHGLDHPLARGLARTERARCDRLIRRARRRGRNGRLRCQGPPIGGRERYVPPV